MNYTKVRLEGPSEDNQLLMLKLMEMGIGGFEVEDPEDLSELEEKKESYHWDYLSDDVLALRDRPAAITFYVEDSPEGMELLEQALSEADYMGYEKVELSASLEDDWRDNWKAYFKPKKVSRRIAIKPTWEEYEAQSPDEIVVEMDPGRAFGTGTHATTSLCIRMMEDRILPGETTVLDVGCGSGILAIVAKLLGAKEALGVEIDPEAVEVAKENVALNKVDVEVREGDLVDKVKGRYTMVVANLMADLVLLLASSVADHMDKGAVFISSGILIEKEETVKNGLEEQGFEVKEILEDGDWCSMLAVRKEPHA